MRTNLFSRWIKKSLGLEKRFGKRKAFRQTIKPRLETLEDRLAPAAYVVTTTADSGPGSLRDAINQVNADTSIYVDQIDFAITGVATITPQSALPAITHGVTIDGTTQPGYSGTPLIELNGSSAGPGANGLTITAPRCTVRGLVIDQFYQNGIYVSGGHDDLIAGNYIGTDESGMVNHGNGITGVMILSSSFNTVGGTGTWDRNVISGNGEGDINIASANNNLVEGNLIGTNAAGTGALGIPYSAGIDVIGTSTGNTIGGTAADARNVISANTEGVLIQGTGASGNTVEGNYIGTDITGTVALGNSGPGVDLVTAFAGATDTSNNTIGGTTPGAGNLIAGNGGAGILLTNGTFTGVVNNLLIGNSIYNNGGLGIDLSGTGTPLPNDSQGHAGPNNFQDFPVLNSTVSSGSDTAITGSFSEAAEPNTTITLAFYANSTADPSGYGQGQTYLGSAQVTTGANGNVSLSVDLGTGNLAGEWITATASDPSGNTSEFAQDIQATAAPSGQSYNSAYLQSLLPQSSTTSNQLSIQTSSTLSQDTVIAAIDSLTAPSQPVTIIVSLNGGTFNDTTVSPPANVKLIIDGSFMVTGGNVIVRNVTFTTATNASPILVTGGSLTLRNDTVDEITAYGAQYSYAALAISGGTVDLGTTADPGNNIFNISNNGLFFLNTTPSFISTSGDTFEINGIPDPQALNYTPLAYFNGSNGSVPVGGVVADSSGNVFGTTNGEAYEVAKGSRTITVVASLPSGYDGGGLIVDSNDNLFGTAFNGIFEIPAGSGRATMLARFDAANGFSPGGPLFEDARGDLFGTTQEGGALGGGTVFELTAGSSTITTVAPLPPSGHFPQSPYFGVIADSAGNLFGTDESGGANQVGRVFEVPTGGGGTVITLASFNGLNGAEPYPTLVEDGNGNLYGVTPSGPYALGTVFELPAADRTHIVALAPFNGSNGAYPQHLIVDTSGNLFGTTSGNNPGTLLSNSVDPTVFEVPAGSGTILTLTSFVGTTDQGIIGLTQDNSGNLIGATTYGGPFYGELGDGTVFEVTDPNPYAGNQALPNPQSTPTAVSLSTSDPNGDPLTYTVTNPANGTLSGTAPNLVYTPNAGFTGNDSFQFRVTDTVTGLVSNTATVSLLAPIAPTINVTDAGGVYNGSSFPAVATLTGRSGTPANSLEGVGLTLDYAQLDAHGNVIADLGSSAPIRPGSYRVTASFPGSTTYLPTSKTTPFAIAKASPTMTAAAGPTVLFGTGAALTDSTTLSGLASMTGTITFVLHDPSGAVVDTETATVNGPGIYGTPSGYIPTQTGTYQWSASYNGDANDNSAIPAGTSSEFVLPVVASYVGNTPGDPDPNIAGNLITSSSRISYTLTFNEPVTGVDASQFVLATTGTISAGSVQVQPVDSMTYTVTVSGITGQGTLGLNLADNGGIRDSAGNVLVPAVAQAVGQVYTIDTNPPVVESFVGTTTTTTTDPNNPGALLTSATSVSYALTFSQPVTGVNAADFGISWGSGTPSLQVIPVSGSNGTAYTITVNGITGNGEFSVYFNTLTGIEDQGGFAFNLTGAPTVPNFPSSQTYTIDQVPPVVLFITPTTPAGLGDLVTSASSVSYTVTFSKPATRVDATDFTLTETGTVAATSIQTSTDPNNPNNWIVTISGITGNGTLGLKLASSNHITDLAGNALSLAVAPVSTLQSLPAITLPTGESVMAVADVNGDGRADLILANSTTNSMSVMLGTGNGTFQNPQPFAVGVAPFNGVVADVSGDGLPDLVVVNPGTDTVSVLLNQGNGTFGSPQTYVTSTDPSVNAQAVAVAHINGDGPPDLVIANSIDQSRSSLYSQPANVSVLLNKGDGTFQAPQTLSSGGPIVNASSVAVADVNGDGKPDIAVGTSSHYYYSYYQRSNSYGNRAVVLLNDGSGNFSNVQNLGSPGGGFWGPLRVAFADLSGSGKADLILGTPGGATSVELNNGNGTFTKNLPLPLVPGANVPFGADLTGSGKVNDLVVSNPGANTVNVFLSVPPVYTIDTPTAHIAADPNASQTTHKPTLLLTATDPLGSQESAAGFTYTINWGDGSTTPPISPTANNGSGVSVNHTFTADGTYLVSVTATNKDGAVSSSATSLVVVSSHASDGIALSGGASAGQVAVSVDGAGATTFSPTDLVLVSGQGGGDKFTVNFGSTLATPITVVGSGTDTLTVHGSADPNTPNTLNKSPGSGNGTGSISWASGAAVEAVTYSGIASINIYGGQGPDYITDPGSQTTIYGGPSANTITITATSGSGVVINGGAGANTYIVDLGNLAGPVSINNSNTATTTTNALIVNGAPGNNTIAASGNQVTAGTQTITDTASLSNLAVNGGSGNNTITVSALSVHVQNLAVNGGGGNNTIALNNIGSSVSSLTIAGGSSTGTNQVQVTGSLPATVTAQDVLPIVSAGGNASVNDGSTFTRSGSFADSTSGARYSATVNYGDGTATQALPLTNQAFALSHVYGKGGSFTVTVTVADGKGGTGTGTFVVSVANLPPVVAPLTGTAQAIPGQTVSLAAAFSDPGVLETHTASFNWGDGSSSAGTVTESNGSGTVTVSHVYGATGSYTVTLTVTNQQGVSATRTFTEAVTSSIYVLDSSAAGALTLSGSASVSVPGVVVVDSSSTSAITASGKATLSAAGGVYVKGKTHTSGQAKVQASAGQPLVAGDPLAGLPAPSTTGLTNYITAKKGDCDDDSAVYGDHVTMTLSPGIYSSIRVQGNATLKLLPGIYYIAGGGLTVSGNASLVMAPSSTAGYKLDPVTGAGVLIYNGGSLSGKTTTYGSITLNSNGSIALQAPTSGTYAGVLIFQDRHNGRALSLNGHSSAGLSGDIYAPAARLDMDSHSSTVCAVIVNQLNLSGNTVAQLVGSSSGIAYTPDQVRTAYGVNNLPLDGTGQTIAIVDAYDNPNIYQALDAFDSQFSATTGGPTLGQLYGPAASFLTVLNQQGQTTSLPATDPAGAGSDNWEVEAALDVEWVHAIAPGAQIILVEADSQSLSDLMTAVATAAQQPGVSVVSMSWGFAEGQQVLAQDEATYDSYFTTPAGHQGVTFVASTGDYGAAVPMYPAFSPNVVAVGGTTLSLNTDSSYQSESGWGSYSAALGTFLGSGGGLSQYEAEPSYQQGVQSTGSRTTPDVSLLADPATGAWVADPYNLGSDSPWEVVGGTSLSAPAWASLLALADQGRVAAGEATLGTAGPTEAQTALYGLNAADYHAVTSGSNGYSAGAGYNLVTGLGSPVADLLIPDLVAYSGGPASSTPVAPLAASGLVYSTPARSAGGSIDALAQAARVFSAVVGPGGGADSAPRAAATVPARVARPTVALAGQTAFVPEGQGPINGAAATGTTNMPVAGVALPEVAPIPGGSPCQSAGRGNGSPSGFDGSSAWSAVLFDVSNVTGHATAAPLGALRPEMTADGGSDVLMGGVGDDLLVGGEGHNLLVGGYAVNRLADGDSAARAHGSDALRSRFVDDYFLQNGSGAADMPYDATGDGY